MEITIKINGRFVSVEVSAEVADYLEQAKRNLTNTRRRNLTNTCRGKYKPARVSVW